MASGRHSTPTMPGLASLIVSWHIRALGPTLGQELLVKSKNIARKLERTVPESSEKQSLSIFSKADGGTGNWARSRPLALSPMVS